MINDLEKFENAYPVINSSKGTRDGSFFSMIEYYDEDKIPVIKIGGHFQRSDIDNLDDVWKKELSDVEKNWAFSSTLGYFKLLDLPLNSSDLVYDHGYSCVYSLTENEVPIISPIVMSDGKVDSNFVVMAGMSGVGAKGALGYGMLAADLLNDQFIQDTMYQYVMANMGLSRLQKDIKALKN